MYYADVKSIDVANGPGVRVSLFVSGCTHHCKECFNQETWDFNYGQPFTTETTEQLLRLSDKPYIAGVTILGGEPMEPKNQESVRPLLEEFRERFPAKSVWMYSGYTFEELTGEIQSRCFTKETVHILSLLDVLVDGEFISEKKDLGLRFRGSSNQRILNMPASLAARRAIWADKYI